MLSLKRKAGLLTMRHVELGLLTVRHVEPGAEGGTKLELAGGGDPAVGDERRLHAQVLVTVCDVVTMH